MKMCEALTRWGMKVELIHPFRVQTKRMKDVREIWSYYDSVWGRQGVNEKEMEQNK